MTTAILAPAALLAAWSLVILTWMAATRLPALSKAGLDLAKPMPGGRRGADLEGVLPDSVNWKAHNYTHLHEQPTVFYALCGILAISGAGTGLALQLAWAYLGLRIAHSLVQVTINYVPVRFLLFLVSSLVLAGMTYFAITATL
ncbi:MAPEG family protein [Haliea sp. E1-2-M8]|uniref:MAPEG family protein n=1 Tax=Haliea sp. E1-2-M8 TaxID=3064706 RepID=UPI002718D298|nr:MAPEG family protein [Haliea sp. E1-2-M8]MDO8863334.1 MAPEG family protein [Haliea sp. E1-2-M8]